MVEPTFRGGDVALFIDWENFKISLAAGNRTPNLSSLKEEIADHGRVVVAKAYADWVTRAPELRGASQFINDPPSLYAAGIEPVFVPTRVPSTQASSANGMRTYRVKNSVDVKMTADCIECAHSYSNIGTFVLVSGDSDFLHVVNALRTMGKRVVIVGVSWSTSRRLADQVDSLLLYDKDVDPLAPQPAVLPQHAPQPVAAQSDAPELTEVIRAIEEIIRDDRAAGGNPLLTSIKQRLMRRYSGFDEKKLGFSGFKKLMARAAEGGNIKLIHAGLVDWAIMADEETPEGAIPGIAAGGIAPMGAAAENPMPAAAKPGRRRGGRRRHPTQNGAAAEEETADTLTEEDAQTGPGFAELPEETAATDFDDAAPEANAAEAAPEGFAAAPSQTDANPEETPADAEAAGDASPEPEDLFGNDQELAEAVREALAVITLPAEPEDGQNPERVSDLIIMADHLEHRQGVRHVAFNFLVAEICGALEQGLAAGNTEIAQRWSDASSRDYVGKMLRGLSDGDFFRRATHNWRDEASGRRRQRSTFNLNRDNALVGRMLIARLGPAADGAPPAEFDTGAPPTALAETPPADSAETSTEALAETPPADSAETSTETPTEASAETPPADSTETSAETPAESEQPQPVGAEDTAVATLTVELPLLPAEDDLDEVYDEPQPKNVRRRPFTSRLLRS